MFPLFGLAPARGRLLTADDDRTPGAHPRAVLSYDFWKRRFGLDPSVIGRRFRRGDTLFEVVGVTQTGFTGTETGTITDIFVPMMMKTRETLVSPNNFWLRTFVKLRPGISAQPVDDRLRATFREIQIERAKSFVNVTQQQLARHFGENIRLQPAAAGRSNLQRDYRRPLGILAILVGLMLLIACANVANLLTARAATRTREMALRVSIGAGRARLVQLLIMESAWIALLATAAGAVFAGWAAPFAERMISPSGDPATLALSIDWRILAFGLLLTLAVTLLFGLAPALRASGVKPSSALKGGDNPHARRHLMHGLIAAQVAFCFLVLFVAELFIGTFDQLANQPIGFSSERLVNLETVTSGPQPAAFWDDVSEHLRAVPGVELVTMTGWPMMTGESVISNVALPGEPQFEIFADFINISPGWVAEMKVPLLGGREFRQGDVNPSVAIVNQAFAKQYFNGSNPVGQWFERMGAQRVRLQIVGLIADARSRDNRRVPIRPTAYIPFHSADASRVLLPRGRGTFVVRTTTTDPLRLAAALRVAVIRTRPQFHVDSIRAQEEINGANMLRERLLAMLASFFAMVSLALAGVGLYGVLDYTVLQRRREIGIRMAIGARRMDVAQNVTVNVFSAFAAGATAGAALGAAAARYVESLLFGLRLTDPRLVAITAVILIAVAMLAALRPLIRAVQVDPADVLRAE
jgi:predicted permease